MENKKIIIVEDQPIIAMDFQNFLNTHGYTDVNYFFKGNEAMENIKKIKPDLAILDIKLKDNITGLEIAQHLKSINVPFIFISAFSHDKNYQKAKKLNPVEILHKPVENTALLNAIKKAFVLI